LAELYSCHDLYLKLIIIKNSPSECVYLSDRCPKASFLLDTSFGDAYLILIMGIIKKFINSYYFAYVKYILKGRKREILTNFYRKKGITLGDNCAIFSAIVTPEPYLLFIGDNVTIAPGVRLITHDNSVSKVLPNVTDVFGKIIIGNNCFIGAGSIILLGVSLGDNSIVAAGSVVTKSFPSNVVVGGNPAKIISTVEDYKSRVYKYSISTKGLSKEEKKNLILNTVKLIEK